MCMKSVLHFWLYLATFLLEWEMFQTYVAVKIKTHLMFNNFFYFANRTVYEIMWRNIVQPGRPQMTIWRIRISCCMPKATNTQSEYVIFTAFPMQQWLHEHASMLRYNTLSVLFNSIISPQDKYAVLSYCPLHAFWLVVNAGSLR